jgi:hypothetical protein
MDIPDRTCSTPFEIPDEALLPERLGPTRGWAIPTTDDGSSHGSA